MSKLLSWIKNYSRQPTLWSEISFTQVKIAGIIVFSIFLIVFFLLGNHKNHNREIMELGSDVTIIITNKENAPITEFFVYCFIIDDTKKEEFVLPVKEDEYKGITIGDKYKAKYIPGDYTVLPFWDSKQ